MGNELKIRNGAQVVFIPTETIKGRKYSPSVVSFVERVTADSTNEIGSIMDRLSSLYEFPSHHERHMQVEIPYQQWTGSVVDTIKLSFIYYLDSMYIREARTPIIIPVR